MSQVRQLVQLQGIDTQLDQAQKRLVEIDAALNDNSAVRKAAARAEKAAAALTKVRLALKNAELDVQSQQDKIQRNQKALYGGGGKSPKELEDLQMESEALGRYLSVVEDRQLEAMLAFEEAESASQAAERALSETKQQAAAGNVDLAAEQAALLAQVNGLNADRAVLAAPIEADLLSEYEKLRRTRMGVAVSEIKEGGCSVCGANLSAAQIQSARSPSRTATCDVCGRILYA